MTWGVFDSGVGGLTVVRALDEVLPGTGLVYLGDTARVPYGIRSRQTVRGYAEEAARFFAGAGVSGLIVACNTASAVALDVFDGAIEGPVIGVVEPGVRCALEATRNGKIGVIGTQATIRSDAYGTRLRALRPDAEVVSVACPLFVPLAEEGWVTGDVPERVARRYLAPLAAAGIDAVILGCTHYPLLAPTIAAVLGPEVTLVDSAHAVARAASAAGSPPRPGSEAPRRFCVTDAGGTFREVAERFLGRPIGRLETVELAPHLPA